MEKETRPREAPAYLPLIVTVFSLGIGLFAASVAFDVLEGSVSPSFAILYVMACFFAAFVVQTVLHELGHLVFGLLSGYRFVSFRIWNFLFLKEHGRLVVRMFTIAGTGGQCLMQPPPSLDGDVPYRLCMLGGCLFNLVSSTLFLAPAVLLSSPQARALFLTFVAAGIVTALINLVPMNIRGILTDGLNTALIGKSAAVRKAFWLQLYASGWVASGRRIGELPAEWFPLPEGDALDNPLCCTVGVLRYDRQFDRHDFSGARETCEYMLQNGHGMLGAHRDELRCELLFLKILSGCSKEEADAMLTPELQKYIRLTGYYVSRKRLFYAYELLIDRNPAAAEAALLAFEDTAKRYPYASDVANEREIAVILREAAAETARGASPPEEPFGKRAGPPDGQR